MAALVGGLVMVAAGHGDGVQPPASQPERRVPIAGTALQSLGFGMTEIDREICRKASAETIELARITTGPAKKEALLTRAQEWLKLAYAKSDDEFKDRVAQLNAVQMTTPQRQPMQQQQSKKTPEDQG